MDVIIHSINISINAIVRDVSTTIPFTTVLRNSDGHDIEVLPNNTERTNYQIKMLYTSQDVSSGGNDVLNLTGVEATIDVSQKQVQLFFEGSICIKMLGNVGQSANQ